MAHGTITLAALEEGLEDLGAMAASAAHLAMMRTEMLSSRGHESEPTNDSSSQLLLAEVETTETLGQATEVTAK